MSVYCKVLILHMLNNACYVSKLLCSQNSSVNFFVNLNLSYPHGGDGIMLNTVSIPIVSGMLNNCISGSEGCVN